MKEEPRVDIVIPVFNEGQVIIKILDLISEKVKSKIKVFICYDFDEDLTLKTLESYKPTFDLVFLKNKGVGPHNAVVTGFEESDAPCVIVMPADDPHNIHLLDQMVEEYQKGNEVVVASRFMKGGCMEGCPWLKAVLVRTASFTLHTFALIPVCDASNGFRLFSRRVLNEIQIESKKGFTYSLELLVKSHRMKFKISEVPAVWFERSEGQSHFKVIQWLPMYLEWYFYGFATTWLQRKPKSVKTRKGSYFEIEPSSIS